MVGGPEDFSDVRTDEVIDLGDHLVLPGLINAHAHTPISRFRGLAEGSSLSTMDGFINSLHRLEAAADAEILPAAVKVSCAEMIRTGTTCFADYIFLYKGHHSGWATAEG